MAGESRPFSPAWPLPLWIHLLFTYSDQFSTEFHVESVVEMAQVAAEVRVFPLLTAFSGEVSPHLPAVMEALRDEPEVLCLKTD